MLHFDTKVVWVADIVAWARGVPRISRVWVFGSRASGARRSKAAASPVPDLDVAYELDEAGAEDAYTYAFFRNRQWRDKLQEQIPVELDLQHAHTSEPDAYVPLFVAASGVLIYERDQTSPEGMARSV
jgi:predicted nucleotidyltransferase